MDIFPRYQKKMDLNRALSEPQVFIRMCTSDPIVQARYNGWYEPMADKKGFISRNGNILPIEGFSISYHIFKD